MDIATEGQQQATSMDVVDVVPTSSPPSPLDALPFPIGWQVKGSKRPAPYTHRSSTPPAHAFTHTSQILCDCLPTPDILRLSTASHDCREHARPCVRRLVVRGASTTTTTTSSDSDSDSNSSDDDSASRRRLTALIGLVAACPRVEEVQALGLGPVGAAQLGYAWAAAHPSSLARCVID
jgi:hypothetical protein